MNGLKDPQIIALSLDIASDLSEYGGAPRWIQVVVFNAVLRSLQKMNLRLDLPQPLPMLHVCSAKQFSDQMVCERCNTRWDVNDSAPPPCFTDCFTEPIPKAALGAAFAALKEEEA